MSYIDGQYAREEGATSASYPELTDDEG